MEQQKLELQKTHSAEMEKTLDKVCHIMVSACNASVTFGVFIIMVQ